MIAVALWQTFLSRLGCQTANLYIGFVNLHNNNIIKEAEESFSFKIRFRLAQHVMVEKQQRMLIKYQRHWAGPWIK